MRTCYFSGPLGIKTDSESRKIDFEKIYSQIIRPTVEKIGLSCVRADDFSLSIDYFKSIITNAINSDIMIADISTLNANVFYEIGLRHALRKGITILICIRNTSIPVNINHQQIYFYDWDGIEPILPKAVSDNKKRLSNLIKERIKFFDTDSPIFPILPKLQIDYLKDSKSRSPEIIKKLDDTKFGLKALKYSDHMAILEDFERSQSNQELIKYVKSLPLEIQNNSKVVKIHAGALIRTNDTGNAIALLLELINKKTTDVEVYTLLGSLYQNLYNDSGNLRELENSFYFYKQGYYLEPSYVYNGLKVLFLSFNYNSLYMPSEEFNKILKNTRKIVEDSIEDEPTDYWTYAAALELSIIGKDWIASNIYISKMIENAGEFSWLLETTYRGFLDWNHNFEREDKKQFQLILTNLKDQIDRYREGLKNEIS